MSFDELREMAQGVAFDLVGLPATLTLTDGTVIATSVIWRLPRLDEQPFGTDFQNIGARKVLGIARTGAVSGVPRGSSIVAAERDGDATKTWRVDGYAGEVGPDHMWLIVVQTG